MASQSNLVELSWELRHCPRHHACCTCPDRDQGNKQHSPLGHALSAKALAVTGKKA